MPSTTSLPVVSALRDRLITFVRDTLGEIAHRYAPSFQLPRFFAGHRTGPNDPTELVFIAGHLHQLGVTNIAGMTPAEIIEQQLRVLDGPGVHTFGCYRVAEGLASFGRWDANPIVQALDERSRCNVLQAVDATGAYDRERRALRGHAENYWGVLARCEVARQSLGVSHDEDLLSVALARVADKFTRYPLGYFDDSADGAGVFDIYSPDTLLFVEPLWPMLPADVLRESLRRHDALMTALYHECGASITWGRSVGALSLALNIEWAAAGLAHGFGDRAQHLTMLDYALNHFSAGFDGGLTTAHRDREQDGYRGIARLMQMTLDLLGKASFAALALKEVADDPHPDPRLLFSARDELIRFEPDGAAVWIHRSPHLAFTLPLVGRSTADYAPTPHSPGLLDTPVDSTIVSLLPRVLIDGVEFAPVGRPTRCDHHDHALHVEHRFSPFGKPPAIVPALQGTRVARYRVEHDTIHCDEEWAFDRKPEAITFTLPECDHPIDLRVSCSTSVHHARLATDGMGKLRSHWSQVRRLHECAIEPAMQIRCAWSLRPAIRVSITPGDHDYVSALVDGTPPEHVAWHRPKQGFCPVHSSWEEMVKDAEIFHLGWPEHLFAPHGRTPEQLQERHERFIDALHQANVKIIWTMHNRLPHHWELDRGRALYEAWARGADGLIHHSQCGMHRMRNELPYRADAVHRVIPHGHFGRQMQGAASREQIEREFGLGPVPIRLGVLGRARRTKNIDMIIRAFIEADRPDQQLILTANPQDLTLLDHPRVRLLERPSWLMRAEIARHTTLCDALVLAHDGPTYLTSGIPADAIGLGVGLIGPDWDYLREHCGEGCIYHSNTQESLKNVFRSLTPEQVAASQRELTHRQSEYDWNKLAGMTYDLYRAVRLARA